MKIGICVGHSRRGDSGATSKWGESEHSYNRKVADALHDELEKRGIPSFVIKSYDAGGYSAGIRDCAKQLRDGGATHAVELHFNAATGKAQGAEWLHWHSSGGGKRMCESLRRAFLTSFPMMTDRGLKPKAPGARGALFLRATHCPAAILEPFFGDNPHDCAIFKGNEMALAKAYANGIANL
jgi:N-acetylmuramoyl-L-alanine amidase